MNKNYLTYRYEREEGEFDCLYDRIQYCMLKHAKKNGFAERKDFYVFDEDWGWSGMLIDIFNLDVLTPRLVKKLRRQLKRWPREEIAVNILVDDHIDDWPRMGLLINEHEVIDCLKRDYLPPRFRTLAFEGERAERPGDLAPPWPKLY